MPRGTVTEYTVESYGRLYRIVDRRVIETCPTGAQSVLPVPVYVGPFADLQCVLCGEKIGTEADIGEMHGKPRPRFGVQDIEVISGLVHAQCGLDAGWEVA